MSFHPPFQFYVIAKDGKFLVSLFSTGFGGCWTDDPSMACQIQKLADAERAARATDGTVERYHASCVPWRKVEGKDQ